MSSSPLLIGILTAVLGLAGVAIGAFLTVRGQHRNWLRDRKIEAVSTFVESTGTVVDRLRQGSPPSPEARLEWLAGLQSGRTAIYLLCDQPTVDALEVLAQHAKQAEQDKSRQKLDETVEALRAFVKLARREIRRG